MPNITNIVASKNEISAFVPNQQSLVQSLYLVASQKRFTNWSLQNHADSYSLMHRIANIWNTTNLTQQYLIYGKVDSAAFHWELIPYQKCYSFIGRIFQQMQVLWRTIFGGVKISPIESDKQVNTYKALLNSQSESNKISEIECKGDDAFCKDDIVGRQMIVTGKKINILFNYAPIGFGGEKLHFLVVPKQHRETFSEVTQEEYVECMELTSKLIDHFSNTRESINSVYLLNKTGKDAGQTVKHWHLHVIFSTNAAQDFWGKITVLKNILLGSSPMKPEILAKRVRELKEELFSLNLVH